MRRRLALLPIAGLLVFSVASAEPATPKPQVYRACPANMVWKEPGGGCICASGFRWDETAKRCTTTCAPGKVQAPNAGPGTCVLPARTCSPGKRWSEAHDACVVVCPAGKAADASGAGCKIDPHDCPVDTQWYASRGACLPFCAPGKSLDYKNRTCVDDPVDCAAGMEWSATRKACVSPTTEAPKPAPVTRPAPSREPPKPIEKPVDKPAEKPANAPKSCPEGKEWRDPFDGCVPICPPDQVLDFYGIACHAIRSRR